jgi:alpha/beta superfamily hydrolase
MEPVSGKRPLGRKVDVHNAGVAVETRFGIMKEEHVSIESSDKVVLSGMYHRVEGKSKASIVLAHGICSSKDYGGFHLGLAWELARCGFDTLRFDFRGHGESGGKSEEMTIAGEVKDLAAAVRFLRSRHASQIGIVGHSFGGGVTVLYSARARPTPFALVLLAPVLDYRRTFVAPETPWTRQWFTPEAFARAQTSGTLDIGGFPIGLKLIQEFHSLDPANILRGIPIPALVIHGDGDTIASFKAAHDAVKMIPSVEFVRIPGAEHYFEGRESSVFRKVSRWLDSRVPD